MRAKVQERGGAGEAREIRRHPSMKDAELLGEQPKAVKQEVRRSKVHAEKTVERAVMEEP